jgi:HEAT repeat protein
MVLSAGACAPALRCHTGDPLCGRVLAELEATRTNAGQPCATPRATAYLTLRDLGRPAAPYLVVALGDRDAAVARQAAAVLTAIGLADDVARWCAADRSRRPTAACRR